MLDEALRIKDILLDVQLEIQADEVAKKQVLLENIRARLGYDEVAIDNDAGLVDTRNEKELMIPPDSLAAVLPVSDMSATTTRQSREVIGDILRQEDSRLIVIAGPCSIHDPEAALEYAGHVKDWREQHGNDLEIVMRAYMEKPRSEKDWKGEIYDPLLDDSDDINRGVVVSRMIACQITNLGVPIAMERLNALTPQYFNGLVAYDAIGARNTTDQKAREYASGTSSPVGFKNTPEGSIRAAVQAVISANAPHAFLGMGMNGLPNQVNTTGNDLAHIIHRGADSGPNFAPEHISRSKKLLAAHNLLQAIIIDASHGNSNKSASRQIEVVMSLAEQVALGEMAISGVMIESNLVSGRQNRGPIHELTYGQSITDECVGLPQTEGMLEMLAQAVKRRRNVLEMNAS
jgi:3-deoxy-7-phosphoheptulonate synthase